ncbi:hypothetical protein RhiirC2_858182 [Rhizophagus irregularis]|uniref:Protein kinase domain-containing protein n=1 Tax=Rhizophagus irregularis TaxID=588596 RepID=A0A2N1M7B3_9GLOM|nr:hypothetical protein RhiirC2_858182 [Rhizophagus irregularis]
MILGITTGLKFLHFKEIIHRLALKDILVNNGKLIIADFGFISKKLAEVITNSVGNRDEVVGYIEPQCFKDITYKKGKKFDIYSLSITIKKNQLKVRTSKVLSEADKIAARLAAARSIKSSTQRNVGMTNQNQDRY